MALDPASVQWCTQHLAKAMGKTGKKSKENAALVDIAKHVLSISDKSDIVDFLQDLIPGKPEAIQTLATEIFDHKSTNTRFTLPAGVTVYRKSDNADDTSRKGGAAARAPSDKAPAAAAAAAQAGKASEPALPRHDEPSRRLADGAPLPAAKSKRRFVNLITFESGQAADMLPGRHRCECMAVKHNLVNNCTSCGRIVCTQEGPGPCFFCSALVATPEQNEILQRGSKKSEKLMQQIVREADNAAATGRAFEAKQSRDADSTTRKASGLAQAEAQRDRLVEYDRTSAARSKVIDDEADYFASDGNRWLSQEEKTLIKAREEKHRQQIEDARRGNRVTLDFVGRRVVKEEGPSWMDAQEDDDEPSCMPAPAPSSFPTLDANSSRNPGPASTPAASHEVPPGPTAPPGLTFATPHATHGPDGVLPHLRFGPGRALKASRVQDERLQSLSDAGMCLSMHQPWASFLIHGIKIHEGRTWYTPHRGRLWIAAAAKEPDAGDIAALEATAGSTTPPRAYPTGCLLGCVTVTDCLSQDEYRRRFPDGDSASPYVLICEDPLELLLYLPIKGQHKIWKLDRTTHEVATGALRQ